MTSTDTNAKTGTDTKPKRVRGKRKSKILVHNYVMNGDWRPWIGKKVGVKHKQGKRYHWAHGYLQIIDYPSLCHCCPCTVAVLTDRDGNVKWSSMGTMIAVDYNVTYMLSQQPSLRMQDLGHE